jgi:hypothetical protein
VAVVLITLSVVAWLWFRSSSSVSPDETSLSPVPLTTSAFPLPTSITVVINGLQHSDAEVSDSVASVHSFFCVEENNMDLRVVTVRDESTSSKSELRFRHFPRGSSTGSLVPTPASATVSLDPSDQDMLFQSRAFLLGEAHWNETDFVLFTNARLTFVREFCEEVFGSVVATWDPVAFQVRSSVFSVSGALCLTAGCVCSAPTTGASQATAIFCLVATRNP